MQRYMRGMSNGGAISARGLDPLTNDQLCAAVPSIFAAEAHESRSERYAYIPTIQVLDGLRGEGFEPFFAQQARTRIEGKEDFTKHMIRLRHRSRANERGEAHEIILINSHDGTSSYQMMSGIFRFVCCNGLFIGDTFEDVKVKHTGDAMGEVIEGAYTVLEDADEIMDGVSHKKGLMLSEPERLAFARAAHALRFEDADKAPIEPERLLLPARREDSGADLWSTYNVLQERVIRGGQGGFVRNANGQHRRQKTRAVTGIDQSKALNRAMATLADEMARLKSTACAA